MPVPASDHQKRKLQRRLHGNLSLADSLMEKVCYLLADDVAESEVCRVTGATLEQVERFKLDPDFQVRFNRIRTHRKAAKVPKSDSQYIVAAKKLLWKIGKGAQQPKDRIQALKALVEVASMATKEPQDEPAPVDSEKLEELKKAMGGGE